MFDGIRKLFKMGKPRQLRPMSNWGKKIAVFFMFLDYVSNLEVVEEPDGTVYVGMDIDEPKYLMAQLSHPNFEDMKRRCRDVEQYFPGVIFKFDIRYEK